MFYELLYYYWFWDTAVFLELPVIIPARLPDPYLFTCIRFLFEFCDITEFSNGSFVFAT
jgi:hypothetical protein